MLGNLDFFGADPCAFEVALAAPCAVWLIHYREAFDGVLDSAVEDVSVGADDSCGSHVSKVFSLADGAGANAACAHDAFDVVIKQGMFLDGLQVFSGVGRLPQRDFARRMYRLLLFKKWFHVDDEVFDHGEDA